MEDNFKPNPSQQEIQVTKKLLPEMENMLYGDPEKVA
jgi:hypothetical protein